MARRVAFAGVLPLALLVGGCSMVNSSVAGQDSVNGEIWYTRNVVFGIVWSSSVYYCPPPQGRGPVTCKEAILHEPAPAAPAPAAAPAQPAAPAEPRPPAEAAPPGEAAPAAPPPPEPAPAPADEDDELLLDE